MEEDVCIHVSDQGPVARMFKELQTSKNKIDQSVKKKKKGNRLEQILQKRDYPMPNSHMKKFSTSLIIKEMKIKAQFYQHTHQMSQHFKNLEILVLARM